MLDKMALAVFSAYYKMKAKVMNMKDEEDGMETVEAVILIAIAVIIAGIVVNMLTKKDWGSGEETGLIGYIFWKIKNMLGFLDEA